jgi:2-polyprenyl-6-methoxyphenol hydroxylase-like FAD-dependent oxidoreductase
VVLLEAHADFKRDFRGDTIHPAILELLDEIGLADRLLATVSHTMLRRFVPPVPSPVPLVFDFGKLRWLRRGQCRALAVGAGRKTFPTTVSTRAGRSRRWTL